MLIPWVLFIPIIFFSYRKCYGVGFKKNILALAQLYEAMSVSYLVSLLSAGILAYVSADDFLGSGVEKWLGGWTLSSGILPGLIFACAYLTTRQYGYVRILKPISKLQAFVFMIIWCITIGLALGDVGIMFTSYDPIILIFTPVTLLLAIAIYRYSKVPKSQTFADVALLNAIFYIAVSLAYWLYGVTDSVKDIVATISIGCTGLIIGSTIYQAAYWWSLTTKNEETIEIRTKNWHFLELLTVYYFFVFAPNSLSTIGSEMKLRSNITDIRGELREVSNATTFKIDDLTIYSTQKKSKGLLCGRVSNEGNITATDVRIELEPQLRNWATRGARPIYVAEHHFLLNELAPYTSIKTCTELQLLNKKDNTPAIWVSSEDFHKSFEAIKLYISYAEDAVHRPDYEKYFGRNQLSRSDSILITSSDNVQN